MIHDNFLSVTNDHILITDRTNELINISLPLKNSQPITLSLADYISKITQNISVSSDTGIMPPGVLYISDTYIIFERPPCYQNIQMIHEIVDNINYDNDSVSVYRIPIPWQLYIVTYTNFNGKYYASDVRMYFMKNSVHMSSMKDHKVYLPPLPNFFPNGLLCRPRYSSCDDIDRYPNNITGVINAAYDWIWNSGTNMDLSMSCVELIYQCRYLSDKNFIIKPQNYSHSSVSSNSYYLPAPYVHNILSSWESISSLDLISQYDWPYPSYSDRPSFTPFDSSEEYLSDYLSDMGLDDYHSCEYDEECECDHPSYDRDHYHEYVRKLLIKEKTLFDMISSVIREEATSIYRNSAYNSISKIIYNSLSSHSA